MKRETDLDRYCSFLLEACIDFEVENDEAYFVRTWQKEEGYRITKQFNRIHDENGNICDVRYVCMLVEKVGDY